MLMSIGSPAESRPTSDRGVILRTSGGFTLLETLVAFAITGVVLASVLPAISGAVRTARDADSKTRAMLWAESILDTFGHHLFISEQDESGATSDGFAWAVSIRRLVAPQSDGTLPPRLAAFTVTVTVHRSRSDLDRGITLSTIRLASPR